MKVDHIIRYTSLSKRGVMSEGLRAKKGTDCVRAGDLYHCK